jgi:pimeloyl-ACP methyl ester carboxylesterase
VRRLLLLVTALALLAVGLPAAAASAQPACAGDSWVAGSVELCDGTLVYRDYVYDDYGAHDPVRTPTAKTTGALSRPAGADRYPRGAEATADLVALSLRIDGEALEVEFELNALFEAQQTIAALAIDTDDDPATGGGDWEGLGVRSDGWEVLETFDRGDPATNRIVGRVPLPAGDRWRVQAVTAQADGTVMNVAFRGTDEEAATGAWWDDRQAAALADGDISEFGHTVQVADLRGGATKPAPAVTGFHQRVYTSQHTLPPGEGMSYEEPHHGRHGDSGEICEQAFHFFGRYQPYGVYVPDQQGPHGMQLALHGCNANHSSLVNQPGMQQRFGEDLNRIVVVPLGRGPVGYYSDISERDVLDVMADVRANHPVDPDRIFSGGYSMGGYGAYRMAQLYPDRFAGMVNWVGFTGDGGNNPVADSPYEYSSGAIGNVIDFVGNLRHVPSALLYGGADELVHAPTALAMAQRFDEREVPYEFFFHPYGEHFTFALADGWEKEAAWTADLERVEQPARVTYRTDERLAYPEYGIRHDRAYWVSGIRGRDEGYVDVDLTTFGCGGEVPTYTEGNDAGVGPAAFAWVSEHRLVTGADTLEQRNALEGELANVSELTVDAGATCLRSGSLHYDLTTDGPVTVRFSDGSSLQLTEAGTHAGTLGSATGEPEDRAGGGARRGASFRALR